MTQYQKLLCINNKTSAPVYLMETSGSKTYQVLQCSSSGGSMVPSSSTGPITTKRVIMRPSLKSVQQARRPLIRHLTRPLSLPQPSLPPPYDYPEIKNFISFSPKLPILSAKFVDDYFIELEGTPPIVGDDFNVDTLDCPMLAPTLLSVNSLPASGIHKLKNDNTQGLRKITEHREKPLVIRRTVQYNRPISAPYSITKENFHRQIRHPTTAQLIPKSTGRIIKTIRPVIVRSKPKTPAQPLQIRYVQASNVPLKIQNLP